MGRPERKGETLRPPRRKLDHSLQMTTSGPRCRGSSQAHIQGSEVRVSPTPTAIYQFPPASSWDRIAAEMAVNVGTIAKVAETEGFEPSVRESPVRRFSKPLVSATHPRLRKRR